MRHHGRLKCGATTVPWFESVWWHWHPDLQTSRYEVWLLDTSRVQDGKFEWQGVGIAREQQCGEKHQTFTLWLYDMNFPMELGLKFHGNSWEMAIAGGSFLMWNSRVDFMLVWQQRVIVMQNMQECDEWSLHIQVFVFPFFLFPFFPCSRLSHWSRLWCLLFSRHRRLGFPQHMWSSMPCSFETSSERLGQSQVGTNRGGCSVKADQRLEMIQLPRFGSRHFSCFASCWQGSKWADVPHFAALCCGYPEVRGGTSGIEKGGYLDLQQLRSYGILVPWHFITCLRRCKAQACWYFKALELFEIIGCTWWMSYKWRYGYAHFGIISFSILKDFCGKNPELPLSPGADPRCQHFRESDIRWWKWETGLAVVGGRTARLEELVVSST